MAKIFITGSSDGLGLMAAKMLYNEGHEVILHARNAKKADETAKKFQGKVKVLVADLSDFEQVKQLALQVNDLGFFDAIIHNAGVLQTSNDIIFKVNTLAAYMLTALINKPKKLIYISSNMHPQGEVDTKNLTLEKGVDYSTSKLQILMLGLIIARKYKDVYVNVVDPGWVKTKMANYNAPDSLEDGSATQVWLASNEELTYSGKYFYHLHETNFSLKADDITAQKELLRVCAKLTGICLPIEL